MSGRKLGRGLDMLIRSRPPVEPSAEEVGDPVESRLRADPPGRGGARESAAATPEASVRVVDVNPKAVAANPEQPRREFPASELENLKASIAQEGLLQPILVRPHGDGYQLVAGERRLRASQELDLHTIPAIVSALDDDRMLEIALIENIQRQDLSPIEVARAYRQLVVDRGWTQEVLARALGVSRSGVANALRLLELPEDMQDSLAAGHISAGHAKVLLSVDDEGERRRFFARIAEEALSVRELEAARDGGDDWAAGADDAAPIGADASAEPDSPGGAGDRGNDAAGGAGPPRGRPKNRRVQALEEKLSHSLGTKVTIQTSGRGSRGKIVIEFYSADDFARIEERLL